MSGETEIIGARTNNLKSLDVVLPLHKATMVIGVSGSGKSSLLADTLATEANARMRRFLGVDQPHLDSEDVQAFVGPVPACIHFAQGAFRASRRTTVGTSAGLLALMRPNFRRYAIPWSEEVKSFVSSPSVSSYGSWIRNHYQGWLTVWTVMARWERTDGLRAMNRLQQHGVIRAIVRSETDPPSRREAGREIDLASFRPLAENVRHLIEAKIGRACMRSGLDEISSLLQQGFDMGGDVIAEFDETEGLPDELCDERGILLDSSQHWVHPAVFRPFAPPSDALLSFNSPSNVRGGACQACQGLGRSRTVAITALVAHPGRSVHEGALSLWTEKNYRHVNIQHETIEGLRGVRKFDPDVAWKRLSEDARRLILFGSGDEVVADMDRRTKRKLSSPRPFPGFIPAILRRAEGTSASARFLGSLTTEGPCPDCGGTRWSRAARSLRLGRWSLPTLLGLTFDELEQLGAAGGELERGLPDACRFLAIRLRELATSFISAGLGHIAGERGMTTLSEGESRRSRLAALLHAQGQGLALLLDEPARGLHEEDVGRLATALNGLKRRHTLIINEHRLSLARIADNVLEIGPGAGQEGGRVINSGPPERVLGANSDIQIVRRRPPKNVNDTWLEVAGAQIHTLADVTCRIPLGRLVSITGVSGSGKSSFVRGILVPALAQALPGRVECEGFVWPEGVWERINGSASIRSVLALEPRAPAAQRRSTVGTLLGLADDLRRIFGKSTEAAAVGLTASDFGWNSGRGRCQTCLGLGEIEDGGRWASCPHCGGRRFAEEVLGVRVLGITVPDLLDLPITELLDHPITVAAGWRPIVEQMVALDLGYLTLGRRADRISGGEHQRLRVARALSGDRTDGLLLILDEPSAGLHPKDVARLLSTLDRVVADGRNTVLMVEHNLDLIRASDWVVDFGPGGGPQGGRITAEGPPLKIASHDSPTGRALSGKHPRLVSERGNSGLRRAARQGRDLEAAARSGRLWLKRLLGDEVAADDLDPVDFEGLAVVFDAAAAAARPYEIGGLDIEIARLLLDKPDDVAEQPLSMARIWAQAPTAQLRIHPLIEELRVWGARLPASTLRVVEQRLKRMRLVSDSIGSRATDVAELRATGKRFETDTDTIAGRIHCVRDALGIGGGYAELWDASSGVLATIQTRPLAFEIPAIAPLSASSDSLTRSHPMGRCPCCAGNGWVTTFDEALVIARPTVDPASESFLHPDAVRILRGVRRSVLLPFLKRIAAEGLWPAGRAFTKLGSNDRILLMHGYWCRPGHGSFLKTPNSDPEDVQSWLRWNGLYRAVIEERKRSDSVEWLKQIDRTSRRSECPQCAGTGLPLHTHAVKVGRQSLFDLVRTGTIGEMAKALSKLVLSTTRGERSRERILYCLEPVVRAVPRFPLRDPIGDPKLLRTAFERTVHSMMQLHVIG